MDELKLIVFSALKNYYDSLNMLGYVNYEDINKILILSYIDDLINTFPEYITNHDYNTIIKVLQCLSSSCFISAPHFMTQESLFKDSNYYKQRQFRLSEDSLFRTTEDNDYRVH